MSAARICAIVVNWNLAETTGLAVRELLTQLGTHDRIVVVDNGSQPPDADLLRRSLSGLPQVELIFSSSNAGFSGGVNSGVVAARRHRPDHYLLLNNDARPRPDAIPKLLEVANETGAGVVGATTVDEAGIVLFNGRRFPGELFGLAREPRDSASRAWHQTGRVDGAAMLIRSSFVEQRLDEIGWLLDPKFFLYWEDVDLCAYVRSKGGWCVIADSAIVEHAVAASSGGAFNPRGSYYQTRNRVFMSRRWLPRWSWLFFDSLFLASRLALQLLRTPLGKARWRAVLHGVLDGYRGRGGPSQIDW